MDIIATGSSDTKMGLISKTIFILLALFLAYGVGYNSGFNNGRTVGENVLGMRYCPDGIECKYEKSK